MFKYATIWNIASTIYWDTYALVWQWSSGKVSVEFTNKPPYVVIDFRIFHFFYLPRKTICWRYMVIRLIHYCVSDWCGCLGMIRRMIGKRSCSNLYIKTIYALSHSKYKTTLQYTFVVHTDEVVFGSVYNLEHLSDRVPYNVEVCIMT